MDIVYFDRGVYLVKKVPKPSLIATRKRENIILIKKKNVEMFSGKCLITDIVKLKTYRNVFHALSVTCNIFLLIDKG